MTHHDGQRWTAVPSLTVTMAVQALLGDEKFLQRYWAKVDIGFDPDDCWVWTGALSSEGYGNFTVGKHTVRAHRVGWIIAYGDIPADLFLDHRVGLCRGRWCVNPHHLEPITNQENTIRGTSVGKLYQRAERSKLLIRRQEQRELEAAHSEDTV